MKKKLFFTGMLSLALTFGLALVLTGCDSGGGGGEAKKYTVTFDLNGGTLAGGQRVQEVEEKKYAAIPTVTPPTGKEADGWDSSVPSLSPDSPITANVTFTAKWKDKTPDTPAPAANPLANTAWYSSDNNLNYIIFSPSVGYFLWATRESPINTVNKEIRLGNEASLPVAKTYKYELTGGKLVIKNSYVSEKGDPIDLVLTRIEGSTKTGVHDVWYSETLTTDNELYTVLVIRSNGDVWAEIGDNIFQYPYEVKDVNTAKPFIKWTDATSGSTDFSLEGNNLIIKWEYDNPVTYTKTTL